MRGCQRDRRAAGQEPQQRAVERVVGDVQLDDQPRRGGRHDRQHRLCVLPVHPRGGEVQQVLLWGAPGSAEQPDAAGDRPAGRGGDGVAVEEGSGLAEQFGVVGGLEVRCGGGGGWKMRNQASVY